MRTSQARAIIVTGFVFCTAVAQAADVRGSFQTLMMGREDPRRGDVVAVVPLYELVALRVHNIELPGADSAQLVMQGWGRLQLGSDEIDDTEADLGLLYLESQHGKLNLRLGRQFIVGGVGRMALIDGIDARLPIGVLGLTVQAYGGANVNRRLRFQDGGYTTGARVAKHFSGRGEVGLGFKRSTRRGEVIRKNFGIDGFTRIGSARLVGLVMLSTDALELVEGRLAAVLSAGEALRFTVNAERTVPDLMLPQDSIFTVFSNVNRDALGLQVDWIPSPYYEAIAQGSSLILDGDYLGYRAKLGVRTFREATHESFIGAELQRLDEGARGYLRGRLMTGLQLLEAMRLAADLYAYTFDEEINGESKSLLGIASVVYDLRPSMRLALSVSGGSTPYAQRQVEGMLRFAYGYEVDFAREMGP